MTASPVRGLAALVGLLAPLAVLAGPVQPGDHGLLATALAAVGAVLVALATAHGNRPAATPPAPRIVDRPEVARRDREAPPRQVDPDAAGHVRSRAPGRARTTRCP